MSDVTDLSNRTRPRGIHRIRTGGGRWPVLAAISAGGMLGAVARDLLATAMPHTAAQFPWSTFVINVSGCLLIGALMVLLTEVWTGRRMLRPFLATGMLGGYTTFSTNVVDVQRGLAAPAPRTALAYLVATPVCALLAVLAATRLTRRLIRPRHKKR
jgi:CrcB protein